MTPAQVKEAAGLLSQIEVLEERARRIAALSFADLYVPGTDEELGLRLMTLESAAAKNAILLNIGGRIAGARDRLAALGVTEFEDIAQ